MTAEATAGSDGPRERGAARAVLLSSLFSILYSCCCLPGPAHADETANLLPNPSFEEPFGAWSTWGKRAGEIVRDESAAHGGRASALLPGESAALYTYVPLAGGHAYHLQGFYRCSGGAESATVRFSLCAAGKGNGTAGTRQVVLRACAAGEWRGFEACIVATKDTEQSQVTLSAQGGPVWFDDLSLTETACPEWAEPAGAWEGITEARTADPLFAELLGEAPGKHHVTMWAHALYRSALPAPEQEAVSDADWEQELRSTFDQMGANHLNAMLLPWGAMGGTAPEHFWRTHDFLTALHEKYGLTFDAAAESSGVVARAVKLGAEVLNAEEVESNGARPVVSPVDPAYVEACLQELQALSELVGDRPYVRAVIGEDEPTVPVIPGLRSDAGPVMQAADAQVRQEFGYGRFGMPAPADPEWQARPEEHPFCWIAFSRWMADRYAQAARSKYETAKRLNPGRLYVPCDLWLMSGHIPFDVSRLAKYADMLQGDPYASSAERTRGRGMYNHGFGAKLLSDLGRGSEGSDPKPVEIIVQAFDYAGYEVTPKDLLEWCSQALRCGATSLCFYASDAPRFNDVPRWEMMLRIAKTVGEMKALRLPRETKTAILYCSTAQAAEGSSSSADEVYTAYALLGEKLGCWFDIVDDRQLARGLRKLSDYRVIYLPLATYAEPALAEALGDWVREGGILLCGDPTAFSWAPDGSDTSDARERLFGVRVGDPVEAHAMAMGEKRLRLFPRRTEFGTEFTARSIEPGTDETDVLARYPDGSPAVLRHALGQGATVLFAANPFTPESLFNGAPWADLLRGIEKEAGEEMGLGVWRFRLAERQE